MNLKLVSVAVPDEVFPHMLRDVMLCARVLLTLLKNVGSIQVRFELLPTDSQFYQDLPLLPETIPAKTTVTVTMR